jgi:hypothetical protein
MPVIASRYRGGHIGYSVSGSYSHDAAFYAVSGGHQSYVVDDTEALRIIQERRLRKAVESAESAPTPVEPEPPRQPPANNPDFEDFVNTAKRAGF